MKLNTVNVTEVINASIAQVFSFTDDEEGNKEAEAIFKKLVKENGAKTTKKQIEASIEDGYFIEMGNEDYSVFITHSS